MMERDRVMMERDRVLYGSRQGCLLRRPERDGVSCRVQNATRRGVATGLRTRPVGPSRSQSI
ncbi:hypothetical protein Taro_018702 [Colocasia esculenta]|uniref:Uncharacterized protein n=1 Tax=Colocasia esculenta TaxID=4460 RepID=A0A843US20_COLES|nr:hypothetical protein [Colocasia esculenta]